MGCNFSSSSSSSTILNIIRVVHLNGYVEDFEYPVTVGEVTGKPPRHFMCTRAQLVSGGPKPLKPATQLEPGHVYFLLPYSTIQSDVSPVDLASMARKLTKIAKTSQPHQLANNNNNNMSMSPLRNPGSGSGSGSGSSPICCSPATSPNRFSGQPENGILAYGLQRSSKARSWKPYLDTIRERSFNRRSESDLQENQSFGDSKTG